MQNTHEYESTAKYSVVVCRDLEMITLCGQYLDPLPIIENLQFSEANA